LIFDAESNKMKHYIVGSAIYMHDKNGSFLFLLGVSDKGDPQVCSLSDKYFKEPAETSDGVPSSLFLSDVDASFREKGLATYMLSFIQFLAHTHYQKPSVSDGTGIYTVPCDETSDDKAHHLFLQGRVEVGGAYPFYVKLGFTMNSWKENNEFHCLDYKKECPVLSSKGASIGYYVDDKYQRLLTLPHWVYNSYPPEAEFATVNEDKFPPNLPWHVPGLPYDQYLCSALVTPRHTENGLQFTNIAYANLLNCKQHVGGFSVNYVAEFPNTMQTLPAPVDLYHPPEDHMSASTEIILGLPVLPQDPRRSLFRDLHVHSYDGRLDAIEAMCLPLYFEGKVPPTSTTTMDPQLDEMSLEIRLNLAGFYLRCARFFFTTKILDLFLAFVVDEYYYAVKEDTLLDSGLASFSIMNAGTTNRAANFSVLASRLTSTTRDSAYYAPLYADLFALQVLFSRFPRPVYIVPVYALSGETLGEPVESGEPAKFCYTQVQVPGILDIVDIYQSSGMGSTDLMLEHYTVVPIMPLSKSAFAFFSAPDFVQESELDVNTEVLNQIAGYSLLKKPNMEDFKKLPMMCMSPEESRKFKEGYCASKWLCQEVSTEVHPDGSPAKLRCPGCGQKVHLQCGVPYLDEPIAYHDKITCFMCYDKYHRPIAGENDEFFFPEVVAPPVIPPTPPKKATLKKKNKGLDWQKPRTPHKLPTQNPHLPRESMAEKRKKVERKVDAMNPSFMYPESSARLSVQDSQWWRKGDDTGPKKGLGPSTDRHLAVNPVDSHAYSEAEMKALYSTNTSPNAQSFQNILKAASELFKRLESQPKKTPAVVGPWMHHPDRPYSEQDLVHLCCLLDRGRALSVDLQATTKSMFALVVKSYDISDRLPYLAVLHSKRSLVSLDEEEMTFYVFRSWLKLYLEWFDPELWEYIKVQTLGLSVLRLPTVMAADDRESYEQQGIYRNDPLLVPLPKLHKVVTTLDRFGVMDERSKRFVPYCVDHIDHPPSKVPIYNKELTKSCHPKGFAFEYVPVARCTTFVPAHHMQIRAIRAEYQTKTDKLKNKTETMRWLGLQADKYVTLPKDWVELNFDRNLRAEAIKRAKGRDNDNERRFVRIPPGNSREDEPPVELRDIKGFNYYYQGKDDNCLIGGFANAIYSMLGPECAKMLLEKRLSIITVDCWYSFILHVQTCVPNYSMKKISCPDVLQWNDSLPLVVQLRSRDMSESHAICIYNGCIFDSASRYVLTKTAESLNWCCGVYGFERHVHCYQLQRKIYNKNNKKKRGRHT
jgi:hypothetical protein